jgi:hypothetical protein
MTAITTFTLTSPTTQQAAPFTIGHCFKRDDVPSGSGVQIIGARAQATTKTTWPDGSLKFVVILVVFNAKPVWSVNP